jgi:hypothetical protein
MTSEALGSLLQAILLTSFAVFAGKLLFSGLYKRYPVLFLYVLFRILNSIWPVLIDQRSLRYLTFWKVTTVLALILYVFLVVELYRLVLEKYRGLQTVGRWAMYASVVIATAISIGGLLMQPGTALKGKMFKLFVAAESGVDVALAVFIILLLAILSRYPIQLSRNVRLHAIIYSAFFLLNAACLQLFRFFGLPVADLMSLVISGAGIGSVLAWLFLLNPAGEKVAAPKNKVDSAQQDRLIRQLEFMNATMLRVSRQQMR